MPHVVLTQLYALLHPRIVDDMLDGKPLTLLWPHQSLNHVTNGWVNDHEVKSMAGLQKASHLHLQPQEKGLSLTAVYLIASRQGSPVAICIFAVTLQGSTPFALLQLDSPASAGSGGRPAKRQCTTHPRDHRSAVQVYCPAATSGAVYAVNFNIRDSRPLSL